MTYRILTKKESKKIALRINEISKALDCCSDTDDDVIDNLRLELQSLIETLEESLALAEQKEHNTQQSLPANVILVDFTKRIRKGA